MRADIFELPKSLAATLRKLGPIHTDIASGYVFSVWVTLGEGDAFSGFLIEQRLAERSEPVAEGMGISFKMPLRVDPHTEATFLFAEVLADVLAYIGRQVSPGT